MKILILKPSSLGDVVQAIPVLRLLKLAHPQSQIFWWLEASLASLLEGDPDLEGIILFDRKRWKKPWHWDEPFRSLQEIRRHGFDWVIDLQSLFRSGTVAWLTNGKLTLGLEDSREGAPGFYDVTVPRPTYHTHAVDWYLEVLRFLSVPVHWNFEWLPERPLVAKSIREKWPSQEKRWIALQPGARWENKRWPIEYFVEMVRTLSSKRSDIHLAIIGGESDRNLGRAIAEAVPDRCVDLTGRTSLPEMVEWLRRCELIVTNDTGPMHVAAALGKPVVAIFGPTESRRTGPYGQVNGVLRFALPCAPCLKDVCHNEQSLQCMRAVTPSRVVDCVETWLNQGGKSSSLNSRALTLVD